MPTRSDLEQVQREAQAAKEEWNEIHQERADREKELEEIRAEAESAEKEARARELVPAGSRGDPVKKKALNRAERLEQRIEQLKAEEEEAKQQLDEAQARVTAVARELAPEVAQDVVDKREELVSAFRRLGEAALRTYLDEILPRLAESQDAEEALRQVLPSVKQGTEPGEDRRMAKRQVRQLEAWVDQSTNDVSAEARLGFLLYELIEWSSRASSPVEEIWEDLPEHRASGSALNRAPIEAANEVVHKMRDGDLPI